MAGPQEPATAAFSQSQLQLYADRSDRFRSQRTSARSRMDEPGTGPKQMSQNLPPQSDFPLTLAEVLSAELTEQRPDEARPVAEQVRSALRNASTWTEREKASDDIVPNIYAAIRGLKEKRTALCLSGGGVRSATFNLGILQGLARSRLLDKFDYLSTVSGGGFIGSWLTAWIYRAGEARKQNGGENE